MQRKNKKFVTLYKLTDAEIRHMEQRLQAENTAEMETILDKQAEQIQKLEYQLKDMKTQQNKPKKPSEEQNNRLKVMETQLAEKDAELRMLKNRIADYEEQLKEVKSHFSKLNSDIINLSYELNKKSDKSKIEQIEMKVDDLSRHLSEQSGELIEIQEKLEIGNLWDDSQQRYVQKEIDDLSHRLDEQSDKLTKIKKFTWDWDDFWGLDESGFFIGFTLILSIVLFLASNGLLIYLQIIGIPILNLWSDALILLGISAFPFLVLMLCTVVDIFDFVEVLLVFLIVLLVAALVMIIINFLAFDIIHYLIH